MNNLTHTRSRPMLSPASDERCTCGLEFRIILAERDEQLRVLKETNADLLAGHVARDKSSAECGTFLDRTLVDLTNIRTDLEEARIDRSETYIRAKHADEQLDTAREQLRLMGEENERLRKDAERYRYMTTNMVDIAEWPESSFENREALESAIDGAMERYALSAREEVKPPGIEMSLYGGALRMGVTQSSRSEDKIWEAVQEAISEGWTPTRFIAEAREAWDYELGERAKAADAEFKRAKP